MSNKINNPATELHKEFIQASQTAIEAAETAEKERQQHLLKLQQERTQEVEKRLEQEKKMPDGKSSG